MSSRTDASTWVTAGFAAAASLLLHLLLWPVGDEILGAQFGNGRLPATAGAMEVSLLPLPDTPEPEDEAAEREPREPTERLVKLDAVADEVRPEDADYVSEFDNRVAQEQRAPRQRPRPGPDPSEARTGSVPTPADRPVGVALRPGRRASDEAGSAAQALLDDPDGSEAREGGGRTVAHLSPRAVPGLSESLRATWGSPGTMDALDPELEEGDGNVLNTRRFRYASFFNRLRDQVAEHWDPESAQMRHDPSGSIVGHRARRTVLFISLNPDGSLHRIRIHEPSGASFLDEEAIRAVRAAAPFSNPPPQLVDATTGHIDFLFGFILEVGGSKRIFRYRR